MTDEVTRQNHEHMLEERKLHAACQERIKSLEREVKELEDMARYDRMAHRHVNQEVELLRRYTDNQKQRIETLERELASRDEELKRLRATLS